MAAKRVHTKVGLKVYRKKLRSNLTPAEAFLWEHLKSKQLDGKRFTKQHSIGNYIVDFYCASQRLVVELDGEVHNNSSAQEYDVKRTEYLNSLDYTVIRFENKLVFDQLPYVLEEIKSNFKSEK
ncbi:endonuclease domain-containing protein [Aureibaculum conchae]|uniref:endonuclease domain-containing protein n=1 Tax=Aureibaculum sp. 2308TA14-22 TaxID=3108392 RepID=UPI0033921F80